MTIRGNGRSLPVFLVIIIILTGYSAFAKKAELDIDYTVSLADPASQQFHIKTEVKNINQPKLDLSLPTWTPGWYTVENYYRNVLRFRITDANGKVLPFTMSHRNRPGMSIHAESRKSL